MKRQGMNKKSKTRLLYLSDDSDLKLSDRNKKTEGMILVFD